MKTTLHILIRPVDALVAAMIDPAAAAAVGTRIEVFDLSVPEPDYPALVDRVFAADGVATW